MVLFIECTPQKKGGFKHIYEFILDNVVSDNEPEFVNEPDIANEQELANEPDLANELELANEPELATGEYILT